MFRRRRPQLTPWHTAGRVSEEQHSADDVVRETGWVFNNETGEHLTLEEFVATGTTEVGFYCHHLGLFWQEPGDHPFVEVGAGIGRMTAGLTRQYSKVIACDLDAAFLERCRETVAQHGLIERLETVHMADGRSLTSIPDGSVAVVFSYITLQHCDRETAMAILRESARVLAPGGKLALNFRTWTVLDTVLYPLGVLVRATWRIAPAKARPPRLVTRLGWQANRLDPATVVPEIRRLLPGATVSVVQSDRRRGVLKSPVPVRRLAGGHPSHWWLVTEA